MNKPKENALLKLSLAQTAMLDRASAIKNRSKAMNDQITAFQTAMKEMRGAFDQAQKRLIRRKENAVEAGASPAELRDALYKWQMEWYNSYLKSLFPDPPKKEEAAPPKPPEEQT